MNSQSFLPILAALLCFSAQGQQITDQFSLSYRPIFFRENAHTGRHCTATTATKPSSDEVYVLKRGMTEWQSGKTYKVSVSEFFSGEIYEANLLAGSRYGGTLISENRTVDVNCADPSRRIAIGKDQPINTKGDYLSIVNVDASGAYGEDVAVDTCQVGSHCDIGAQGLVLKDVSGKELWGSLVAIRDTKNYGHPTYRLPNLYRIQTGGFSYATKLLDGTALLSFDDLMTIRITLNTGAMTAQHPDVSLVSLKTWAQLKKILADRFLIADSQCSSAPPGSRCDWQRRTELYFYTLRDYLYPNK